MGRISLMKTRLVPVCGADFLEQKSWYLQNLISGPDLSAKHSILHTRHFHQILSQFLTSSKASTYVHSTLGLSLYFPISYSESKSKYLKENSAAFCSIPQQVPKILFIWFQSFSLLLPDLYCPTLVSMTSLIDSNHSLKFPKQSPRPWSFPPLWSTQRS